jgi:hypothetical protein
MNAVDGLTRSKFLISRHGFLKSDVVMNQGKETHSAETNSMMEEVKGDKLYRDVIS